MGHGAKLQSLEEHLQLGQSVWTATHEGLQRRVSAASMEAFAVATKPRNRASDELTEAWKNVYGRHPNASDAWDHAIKACEAVLIPIVCPKKDKANLGSVAGILKAQPHLWQMRIQSNGSVGSVETFEAMLRLIWPNPDRHEGGTPSRTPTLDEAKNVLHLAVLIVQWANDNALVPAPKVSTAIVP